MATAVDVTGWMQEIAAAVEADAAHLTQLDSAIGDGDHGVNMTRGFRAVLEALGAQDGAQPPGKLLITAGKTLVSTVGGASGPLWGTALRRAGRAVGDAPVLDGPALAAALEAALAGVTELGAAEEGDKTMVDALAPAVRVLRSKVDDGDELRPRDRGRRRRPPRRARGPPCRSRRARAGRRTWASGRSGTRTRARARRR